MNKFQSLKILENNGDSVINFKGGGAVVATTDFSTPYIRSKRFTKLPREKNTILVWDWSGDSFKAIDVATIKNIKPLSDILRNVTDGEERHKSW